MSMQMEVFERYQSGAKSKQPELCCPIDYDPTLLKNIPQEILEKDYGCGDPSRYVQPGDTVLDLGSGTGKICYIAAQLVGATGKVIGVDMNDEMLAIARKYQNEFRQSTNSAPLEFHKGLIQDLSLSLDATAEYLQTTPIHTPEDLFQLKASQGKQKSQTPLIASNSVDLVISNCVLNLVDENERQQMIDEIFRVLKPGGRIAISDIVCDKPVPQAMKQDAELWSGCLSGAWLEDTVADCFYHAGFLHVRRDKRSATPWQVIHDIAFYSETIVGIKPPQAQKNTEETFVSYKGPYQAIYDDWGNEFIRGQKTSIDAMCLQALEKSQLIEDFIVHDVRPVQQTSCC